VRLASKPVALRFSLLCSVFLIAVLSTVHGSPSFDLEKQLSDIFAKRSFTLRNFYRGGKLRYDTTGILVSKAEPGYWSRDGMVLISKVKLIPNGELVMEGDRYCVEFDTETGEFLNVRTGDHVEITVSLAPNQTNLETTLPVLQKVFITSHEKLETLAPSYWANCLSQRVSRPGKGAPWECEGEDKEKVRQVSVKDLAWEAIPPDNTLHNGIRQYLIEHRVGYVRQPGVSLPSLEFGPDPIFTWAQERVKLGQLTLALSAVVGADGRLSDIAIVTPVGMGLDDDAVQALKNWRFTPGKQDGKLVPARARIEFLLSEPNARPSPRR
jgi:TonB family protein